MIEWIDQEIAGMLEKMLMHDVNEFLLQIGNEMLEMLFFDASRASCYRLKVGGALARASGDAVSFSEKFPLFCFALLAKSTPFTSAKFGENNFEIRSNSFTGSGRFSSSELEKEGFFKNVQDMMDVRRFNCTVDLYNFVGSVLREIEDFFSIHVNRNEIVPVVIKDGSGVTRLTPFTGLISQDEPVAGYYAKRYLEVLEPAWEMAKGLHLKEMEMLQENDDEIESSIYCRVKIAGNGGLMLISFGEGDLEVDALIAPRVRIDDVEICGDAGDDPGELEIQLEH